MCRMFAFMSRVSLKVQRSLVKADNALHLQSREHPHGWGIAYYLSGDAEPTEVKSVTAAFTDERFARVSEFLTSHAVVAHVRKATVGELGLENTHPFQWQGWSFCHNGTVFGFREIEDEVRTMIHPRFLDNIEGTTDSETLFYVVLSALADAGFDVDQPGGTFPDGFADLLAERMARINALSQATGEDEREAMLNFLLTNGKVLLATRFNGALSFSTQKKRCADFDICPIAEKVCFGPRRTGVRHTHVLLASDPTSPDDEWEELPNRGYLTVDDRFHLHVAALPGLDGPPAWFA
jgi:predicted glutamine amidotransferase